jgi:hypothetical protein
VAVAEKVPNALCSITRMGRLAFCIQCWVFSSLALRPTQQPDKNTMDKTKNELLKMLIGVRQFKD